MVPGSTIGSGTGIDTQCIATPGISGQLTLDDDEAGNVTMNGTLGLMFTIDAIVDLSAPACTLILQAVISTDSSNTIDGSGTGSVSDGGSVTLADLGGANAGFNVEYASTGNVTCAAEPPGFAGTVCNLAGGLAVGDNSLPLQGDPGVRFWPVLTFQDNQPADGKLEMQYATGPTTIAGWALNNPPDLANGGSQFIATTGVQQ
jgi:hypothetical protein